MSVGSDQFATEEEIRVGGVVVEENVACRNSQPGVMVDGIESVI